MTDESTGTEPPGSAEEERRHGEIQREVNDPYGFRQVRDLAGIVIGVISMVAVAGGVYDAITYPPSGAWAWAQAVVSFTLFVAALSYVIQAFRYRILRRWHVRYSLVAAAAFAGALVVGLIPVPG